MLNYTFVMQLSQFKNEIEGIGEKTYSCPLQYATYELSSHFDQ